ncbi:deoxynucleoside kinase [Microbacterium sp. BH-3-3-3]|uniref:deoxynucleoside kinase n=1 Tax=Microbacterium sp. BH-3-3-3 TaxID=1906742 RepID=UPI0015E1AEA3|nr:deoxynucleoside kinase [Microbacterium sp. BH-3-3-3]
MSARYVVVTGAVGAGATTVSNVILRRWDADPLLEDQIETNNPFFKDAQTDPERWAFSSQAHFLAASVERHARLRALLETTETDFVVEDRTPFEHHGAYVLSAYRLGHLSEREYELLTKLAREIEKQYLIPDLLVYREMTDEQLVERVLTRGRDGESADHGRLSSIHEAFEAFADKWDRSPLTRVPADLDVLDPDGEETLVHSLSTVLGSPKR